MRLTRLRAGVLTSLALVAVTACGSGSSSATPGASHAGSASPASSAAASPAPSGASLAGKRIAWVAWGNDGYQQGQTLSFKNLAEAEGADVTIIDGKNDPLTQARAIDDLIAAGVDGIVWQPADPAAAVQPAKAIRAANIPLVFVGVAPDAAAGVPAPLIPFNYSYDLTKQAGELAAKFVTEELGQAPKAVLFDLLNLPLCHDERMQGFFDGIKSVAADAQPVFWDTVPTTKDGTQSKMENVLQGTPDFNIFSGCGGDLILGGVSGLQAAGRGKAVDGVPQTEWILTIDGTPAELQLLLDPTTSVMATMTLTPYENGSAAWDTLKKVVGGELAQDSDFKADTGAGILFTKDQKCSEINDIYQREYGLTEVYQPIDCSKFGG